MPLFFAQTHQKIFVALSRRTIDRSAALAASLVGSTPIVALQRLLFSQHLKHSLEHRLSSLVREMVDRSGAL